jgi:hypothetical protein
LRRHGPFGEPQLLDDLNDHWTCDAHTQEQLFVLQLLHDVAASLLCHITILSGDVHTSCVHELQPVLEGQEEEQGGQPGQPLVVNIVSSGIRHSPMPAVVASVIKNLPCQTNLSIGDKLWSVVPREWQKVVKCCNAGCGGGGGGGGFSLMRRPPAPVLKQAATFLRLNHCPAIHNNHVRLLCESSTA